MKRSGLLKMFIMLGAGAVAILGCCHAASAQSSNVTASSSPQQSAAPNITGFWMLRFDSRNVPEARLAPSVTAKQIAEHKQNDAHAVRWCLYQGTPAMMDAGAPIDITQGATQIAISSEAPSAARHIYLDRTARPDPITFDETPDGFSIGHWEGDTLVVETQGFSNTGFTGIPGGGFRTLTSHLTERYQLVDGGRELEVSFTWTDPKVFARPHTYAFRYYRVPRGFNAGEFFCDANDQERADFLSKPPLGPK